MPVVDPYQLVLVYLALVRELVEAPNAEHDRDFGNRVVHVSAFIFQEREDIQVISFYAWLRARTLGRPYYEVLLEIAHA